MVCVFRAAGAAAARFGPLFSAWGVSSRRVRLHARWGGACGALCAPQAWAKVPFAVKRRRERLKCNMPQERHQRRCGTASGWVS